MPRSTLIVCGYSACLAFGMVGCDSSSSPARASLLPDGGAAPAECVTSQLCVSATPIGKLSGDMDAGTLETTGTGPGWYQFHLTEDNSSITGHPLHFQATLTAAPGTAYGLHAYVDTSPKLPDGGAFVDGGALECAAETAAAPLGAPLDLVWGEPGDGGIANGLDDGRNVVLEVRYASGPCSAWTLDVRGN